MHININHLTKGAKRRVVVSLGVDNHGQPYGEKIIQKLSAELTKVFGEADDTAVYVTPYNILTLAVFEEDSSSVTSKGDKPSDAIGFYR